MPPRVLVRLPVAVLAFAALALGAPPAAAQKQGKRADITDVSKAVRGETPGAYGPTNLPRPPKTDDGRDYVYLDALFVTAVRDRRPARVYSFWPRLTLSREAPPDAFWHGRPRVRDALMLALAEVAQVDWPGETKFDAAVASRLARERADASMGGGVIDAVDFLHIEMQPY